MTDSKEAVTSSAGARHHTLHTPLVVVSVLDRTHWQRRDRHSRDEGVRNVHRDIRHEEVGRDRVEGRGVRHEEESGSALDRYGSIRHEVENDDDNSHDVDYTHGEGAHHDAHGSPHQEEDSHHGVEASENDHNARTKVPLPAAKRIVRMVE